MVLGLLSDTHMPYRARCLPDELWRAFAGVDFILHAGDLNDLDMLDPLRAQAPVYAVYGNTDGWDVMAVLPPIVTATFDGVVVGLTHGHQGGGNSTPERAARALPEADVVVFGHSHVPLVQQVGRQLLVNPGSPTDRRRMPTHSCARLYLEDGVARAELVTW